VEKNIIKTLQQILNTTFERTEYATAVAILEQAQRSSRAMFEFPVKYGMDLSRENEKYLTEKHFKYL